VPIHQQQIGLGALEKIGGGTQDLGAHLLCRGMGGVAGHHRAAAGEGADPQ
jgi:hypothetical protein